jgi:hypothetical protein
MLFALPRHMNRCRPPRPTRQTGTRNHTIPAQQAERPLAGTLTPPPTHLHRPAAARPTPALIASEAPQRKLCTQVKAKTPLTRGYPMPEVGLELHSLPRKHWGPA